jgi:hypothetical protein
MKRLVFVTLAFQLLGAAALAGDSHFMAGFAKSDITPSARQIADGEIHLGGFFPIRAASHVRAPISTRAMVISNASGDASIAYVSLDAPGLNAETLSGIRKAASELTGISIDRIFVSATHTHFGPDLQGLWGGVSGSYREWAIRTTAEAIESAFRAQRLAILRAGKSEVAASNRRGATFTDHTLTVLDAVAVDDGTRLGTLVNFASHPVIEPERDGISPDFVGPMLDELQTQMGGIAVFVNGAVGDALPLRPNKIAPVTDIERRRQQSIQYSLSASKQAIQAIRTAKPIGGQDIALSSDRFLHVVSNPLLLAAHEVGKLPYTLFSENGHWMIEVEVASIRIGANFGAVSVPGEATTRVGIAIRKNIPTRHRMLLGLTQGTLGYFIGENEWSSGYEETWSIDSAVGSAIVERSKKCMALLEPKVI